MATAVEAKNLSREDRLWEAALTQLTAEGVMGQEQVADVLERHHQIEEGERERTRRGALIELAGYVGAALTVGGVAAISSQVWDGFSDLAQVLMIGTLAAVVLASATLIARFTPGGLAQLQSPAQGARRRLVAVLGVAGAGLTAATIALAFDQALDSVQLENWAWVAAATGLAISAVVYRFAAGVVPTLAIGGFLAGTTMLVLNGFGWLESPWVVPLAMIGLAAFGALVLAKVLKPAVLVEVISIIVWLNVSIPLLSAEAGYGISASDASAQLWIGRIGLLLLIALGAWKFMHGGQWPWAIAVAVGSAAFIGFTFAEALGGAIAMTIAGIVLIVISVLLLRSHRDIGAREPDQPAGI